MKQRPAPYAPQPQVGQLLLVTVAFLAFVTWVGGAYSNGDPLWFYGVFAERPSYAVIYRYGETIWLFPGDTDFENLVTEINAEIVENSGYVEGLRPSGESLEYYQTKGAAIELVYSEPVLFHTHYFFPKAPRLFVALDGSYNYVGPALLFRGSDEQWLPGGIVLKTAERIKAAAANAASR